MTVTLCPRVEVWDNRVPLNFYLVEVWPHGSLGRVLRSFWVTPRAPLSFSKSQRNFSPSPTSASASTSTSAIRLIPSARYLASCLMGKTQSDPVRRRHGGWARLRVEPAPQQHVRTQRPASVRRACGRQVKILCRCMYIGAMKRGDAVFSEKSSLRCCELWSLIRPGGVAQQASLFHLPTAFASRCLRAVHASCLVLSPDLSLFSLSVAFSSEYHQGDLPRRPRAGPRVDARRHAVPLAFFLSSP